MTVRRRTLLILALLALTAFAQRPQTGNPLNFHISLSSFTGNANLRPNITGQVITGFYPSPNGSATSIGYIRDRSVFVNQGAAFGDLGRNAVIGPGWSDPDIALTKNTRINERFTFRADAFDSLNQINFTNPGTTVGSSTFGIITSGTRYAAGYSGTSHQMQMSAKLIF